MKGIYGLKRISREEAFFIFRGLFWSIVMTCFLISVFLTSADAQYFGRNKVKYEDFNFKVMHTEQFDIYYYPMEETAVTDAARMAERWYKRFSSILEHELSITQPVILYANHADFQQTNIISGLIPQGTGGVTEGMKNRVVMPITGMYHENDHVLGHELVHAFQYSIMRYQRSGLRAANQIPLWFIEGMSEYLTIGREYPLTAMWMRDAVLHDDVPSIKQVTRRSKYFPYRYGHAIWAYIAANWGDATVGYLLKNVLSRGWQKAFQYTLGMNIDSLSSQWNQAIRETYSPQISGRTKPKDVGEKLIGGEEAINLAPKVSPNGKYIALISRQNIFSLDLYLADAETGDIIDKLVSSNTDAHFDALSFMNSSGTWSPDGKQFAFIVFKNGDNHLALLDVPSRDIKKTTKIEDVQAITDLAWSPDGNSIVIAGTSGGISNLYLYDMARDTTVTLTDDRYADIQPAWSPDGQTIAFVTDRRGKADLGELIYGTMKLAIMDVSSGRTQLISLSSQSKHIMPQFSPDARSLYFVADPDGISDLYRYSFDEEQFYRVTEIATGISGLTELSPCMSVARKDGRIVFSVFEDTNYNIYGLDMNEAQGEPYTIRQMAVQSYAKLPPVNLTDKGLVYNYLHQYEEGLPEDRDFKSTDYDPTLTLTYVGQPAIGVSVDRFGTSLGGGVSFLFSDMLNNRVLGIAAQLNGGIKDIGGQALYQNQNDRLTWGVVGGHIPYRTMRISSSFDTLTTEGGEKVLARELNMFQYRIFNDRLSFLTSYPLSRNRRLEFNAGYNRISYDLEVETVTMVGNIVVDREEEDLDAPSALNFFQSSIAYVGDYSFFGFTSPVDGRRFRFEIEPTFGSLRYMTALADYRYYFFKQPVTFGVRLYHIGRYLRDAEDDRLTPLFIGYETLVRGYSLGSFDLSKCSGRNIDSESCPKLDRLIGSRIGIMNMELRVPLFGTKQFGLINFPFLPTDFVAFLDGGVAWTKNEQPKFEIAEESTERIPVFSAGAALRINLLGYLVGQVYYAVPFQRPEKGAHFGFVIAPGW